MTILSPIPASPTPEAPTAAQINPPVSHEIFAEHPEATFWIGVVASSGEVEKPELYDAEARMRGVVYIKQMGFLSIEHADTFGREHDDYDDQSVHLVVVENQKDGKNARLVGTSRLILKEDETQDLPIESDFADVFDTIPSDIPAVEVSRFISRHENQMTQHAIAISLIRAMTYQVAERNIDSAYFEIEKPLLKLLKIIGLPLEVIGEPKEVIEPGGVRNLYPIKITPSMITDSVTTDEHNRFTLRDFFKDEAENGGMGYFPESLTGGTNE